MTPWHGPAANQRKGWDVSRTHGMKGTPTYFSWANMMQRCLNPNNKRYPSYGGRGITVCERWKTFENFLADMGERPPGTTLGRIGNSKGYYPLNCRWETRQEQYDNTRRTHSLYHDGKISTIAARTRELGLSGTTIITRIKRGWKYERVVGKTKQDTRKANNKSGFPNVYPVANLWASQIKIDGKMVNLGRASTPRGAYILRVNAAKERGIQLPEGDYFVRANRDQGA
jgi:hypothetical protein